MGGLYDADIVKWSQQQSELLRRIAAGEPIVIDMGAVVDGAGPGDLYYFCLGPERERPDPASRLLTWTWPRWSAPTIWRMPCWGRSRCGTWRKPIR